MTYDEFKRELYTNLLHRKEASEKWIKLLERHCICADRDAVRLVQARNAVLYGRSEAYVGEDMLCIAWEDWNTLRMLYWRILALYNCFLREGWQGVLPDIIAKLQLYGQKTDSGKYGVSGYDLERLIIRPLNYRSNREELKNCVYWRYGDVALVLHDLLPESGEDRAAMKCSRDMVRQSGLSNEVIMVNALLQTCALLPPRLYLGNDIRRYFGGHTAGVFMPGEKGERTVIHNQDKEEGMLGYRLTNTICSGGAAAFFYPGVQERIGELLQGDYYVGFVSVHEAVIHPVRHKSLGEMKTGIERISTVTDRQDVLTTSVYYYSRCRKRLFET